MARGYPSLLALLGLVAVAGYQNRDKIAEMIGGTGTSPGDRTGQVRQEAGGVRGVLDSAREAARDGGPLGFLNAGLRELVEKFTQSGRSSVAKSWVSPGTNQAITPDDLKATIGPETLAALAQRTGLSENELLERLAQNLPSAVDRYTPDGRLPG